MKSTLIWIICTVLVAIFCVLLLPVAHDHVPAAISNARVEVTQISVALDAYRSEYGTPPAGDQRAIIRCLLGDNLRKIVFLELRPKQKSPDGYCLDPWGSPYRIDLTDPEHPKVSSPGRNKKYENPDAFGSDDIYSWR